jgi:uncharacterized protein (TIGR03067 family)
MKKLLVVLTVGLLLGADAKDDGKKELEKFQGEWTVESGERDGQKFPEEVAKSLKRTVKGDKTIVSREGQVVAEGTITLDPTKKPKTIDIKLDASGETVQGIYELDGDTLKICYAAPGMPRPKEFATKEGSGLTLGVWKRVKK